MFKIPSYFVLGDHCTKFNEKLFQQNGSNYPWRTSSFGDWSGLQIKIQLNDSKRIPNISTSSGILVCGVVYIVDKRASNFYVNSSS